MAAFEPNKQHLREVLLFCFNWGKTAADAQRLLAEVYGDLAPAESTCRKWFHRFRDGDFGTDDQERPGQPQKFADDELEELLDMDRGQTLKMMAEALGVTEAAVSKRLHSLGMVQKQCNWVPYELKPRDVERRLVTCEMLLERQKRKGFLHRIITGDEKWIQYDNPKRKKSWCKPGKPSTSIAKPNIHGTKVMLSIWWDQRGVVFYELLKQGETITGERYRQQLIKLRRALTQKRPEWDSRHEQLILQHDNARPHVAIPVKNYLENIGWEVLPHPPYSPDVAPSDYNLFRSMAHGLSQ